MKRRLCDRFATLRLGRAEARAEMVAGWAWRGGWAGARSVRCVWGGRGAGPAGRGAALSGGVAPNLFGGFQPWRGDPAGGGPARLD